MRHAHAHRSGDPASLAGDLTMMTTSRMTRRQFFEQVGKGSLVVGFSLSPVTAAILAEETRAASANSQLMVLSDIAPHNDAWLTIDHQGNITLFSGKVEIGTGTQTAFMQIVAEELYVDISGITYVQGDTSQTPDQGFTAGSKSIQVQGPLVRRAAATAFQQLLSLASSYLGASASDLVASGGSIGIGPDMKHPTTYAKLIAGQQISLNDNPSALIKDPSAYKVVGQPVRRVDLLDKFTGRFSFVSDIVVPGMLHGRVVRVNGGTVSKAKNATNPSVDDSAAKSIPGYVQTVNKENFVGVVATTEWAAIQAAKAIQVTWTNGAPLVSDSVQADLQVALTNSANVYSANKLQEVVGDADAVYNTAPTNLKFTRSYYTPYHMHGAVGPSCAVANVTSAPDANGIQATVWSGTQGVYPLQQAIADILGLPLATVRIIYVEGAGCYGHNGADDAAADAALMSQLVGKPVRLQWMRWDEHGWEPLGPAMAHTLKGALNATGNVISWGHTVNTPPHNSRPGGGANLLAGQETGLIPPNLPAVSINAGTRNGPVNYNFPNLKLTANNVQPYQTTGGITAKPLVNTLPRSTALRSLGGLSNCFANESFMDELAQAANADPIAFRKQYVCALSGGSGSATSVPVAGVDPRAAAALDAMAAQAGWGSGLAPARAGAIAGKGVAFARYETVETYVAAYAEVEVTTATGDVWVRRVVVAHDCGLIINPDGLKNQIEGNVIQGISRTLIEQVSFNGNGVTSLLWSTYPVVHFNQVPSSIEIVLLDHPEQLTQDATNVPSWGAGEPTIGPIAPAIGNAIFNAIGKRLTVLPITKQSVLNALAL
jgi:CO/xanthine dehydrogenase Mo-binding subunit